MLKILGDKIMEDEMGGARMSRDRDEKWIHNLMRRKRKKELCVGG
jgi:hypothetical protein